jgi:sugar/nucleoside kinase (ribokinase family)
MKNFDICLHGNLILDKVYVVDGFRENDSNAPKSIYKSPGALMNMVRSILTFGSDISIAIDSCIGNDSSGEYIQRWLSNARKLNGNKIVDNFEILFTKTSEAVIITDISKNNRTSIVSWGACSKMEKLKNMNAKWDHVLYLDKLPKLNSFHDHKGSIISTDICGSVHSERDKVRIFKMLPCIDYFFASEEEAQSLTSTSTALEATKKLGKLLKGHAIIHSPRGSLVSDSAGDILEFKCETIIDSPVDVLGAGDHFASSFIAHRLKNKELSIDKSVEFAHQSATSFVQNKITSKREQI